MKFNRILSMLLSVLMLLSLCSAAFADAEPASDASAPAEDEAVEVLDADAAAEALASAEPAPAAGETTEALALAGTDEAAVVEDAAPADWTVMIYLCGTDLESKNSMATINLEEIAKTTPNDSVNVVIQTGGCKEWHAQDLGLDIDLYKTQRYHYDADGFTLDEELPLANMANAATLTDFVQYCATNFPAEKNLLVIWDHGGGSMTGLIVDEMYNDAIMSLDQLEAALTRAGVPLEAVLLDTCLMASLETAQALQSSTHYLIASEETVPGEGSDYKSWLQFLYDMPECSGRQFGRRACDSIQQKYAQLGFQYDALTLSVIDLTQLDAVTKAFNELFAELRTLVDDPAYMLAFSNATRRTESYMFSEMIDLGDLIDRARGFGVTNKTANALLSALSDAVVYNVRGVDHSYSTGLSFYYAPAANVLYLERYARSCKNADYLAFIDRVNVKWTAPSWVYDEVEYLPDIMYDDYGIALETEVTEDGVLHLSVNNGISAISSIDAVLYAYQEDEDADATDAEEEESGTWFRLGHDAYAVDGSFTTGEFTAAISGMIPSLSGNLCEMEIVAENQDYTLYQIPIEFEDAGGYDLLVMYRYDESLDLTAMSDESDDSIYAGSYEILGIRNTDSNTAIPGRNVYALDQILGYNISPVITEVSFPDGEENGTVTQDAIEISEELEMQDVELPAGRYAFAFSVTDVFGANTLTELAAFTWDGETAVFDYEAPEVEDTADEALEPAA